MKRLGQSASLFILIGLMIYAGIYYAAEQLMLENGRSNPFFKIATLPDESVDWVILGASHAMPLDFGDFNALMQRETGRKIVNLAAPGAGPLYNRFVLEHFLRSHRARNLLYVVDSFAFGSRRWNEERFADGKLLGRTPLDPAIGRQLWDYARHEGVDMRAVLDYASGFSKINNRERFQPDVWEGEAQFERAYRPSSSAVTKRIDYLFSDPASPAVRDRYLAVLSSIIALARNNGIKLVVIKMPLPQEFYRRLPDETGFDAVLSHFLTRAGVPFYDFSDSVSAPRLYFDTDHLNRMGLTEFFLRDLKPVLGATGD